MKDNLGYPLAGWEELKDERDAYKSHIENMEKRLNIALETIAKLTKERDDYKWMYEGLCK